MKAKQTMKLMALLAVYAVTIFVAVQAFVYFDNETTNIIAITILFFGITFVYPYSLLVEHFLLD